ncbi:hypothetical protein [Novilysobacter arseniciresistens]|uniref:hypothetical protein n=1 Tax=Novilysobacter arseniciresistens TaxID=1385522 RepID=UPI000B0310D9|nr:hypothetical protein [Lysobacter arseniciresistens]
MCPRNFLRPAWGVLLAVASCWALPLLAAPDGFQPAASVPVEPPGQAPVTGLGAALGLDRLDRLRGGDGVDLDLVENTARTSGEVADNHAESILSGNNTLSGEAFSGASGINTAIQNSGSNVLIQNATVVNVRFGDPGP